MGGRIIFGTIIFFIVWGMIGLIPKYPEINPNKPYEQVIKQITDIVMQNAKKSSFEYMDDKRKILDMKKDIQKFSNNLQECKKDTECLVDEYDDYMDDNVADSLRKLYRYQYVENNYGKVGVLINDSLKELY